MLRHRADVAEQVAVVGRVFILHVGLEVAVERQVRALPQRAAAWSQPGCAGCGGLQGRPGSASSLPQRGTARGRDSGNVSGNQARHYSKGSSEGPGRASVRTGTAARAARRREQAARLADDDGEQVPVAADRQVLERHVRALPLPRALEAARAGCSARVGYRASSRCWNDMSARFHCPGPWKLRARAAARGWRRRAAAARPVQTPAPPPSGGWASRAGANARCDSPCILACGAGARLAAAR